MPRVPPFDRPATYDDLVALPDIYNAEIVAGQLYATRRLPPLHCCASSALGMLIGSVFHLDHERADRWSILFGPEIHLGSDVVVPDWAGWKRSRPPIGRTDALWGQPSAAVNRADYSMQSHNLHMWISRDLEHRFRRAARTRPVVALTPGAS